MQNIDFGSRVDQISDFILLMAEGVSIRLSEFAVLLGSRMDQKQRDLCFLLEGLRWFFSGILLCAGSTQAEK